MEKLVIGTRVAKGTYVGKVRKVFDRTTVTVAWGAQMDNPDAATTLERSVTLRVVPTADQVVGGRLEYYLEYTYEDVDHVQGFALELLATSVLDMHAVQQAIDEQIGTEHEEDGIADAVTRLIAAKTLELNEKLGLDL